MAVSSECCGKDEYKTHFSTREGVYNLMSGIEYYRPNRASFAAAPIPLNFVHLSLVSVRGTLDHCERLCLNIGRELYIYVYRGVKAVLEFSVTIDKKSYKMITPTCHNFNDLCASVDTLPLLVGFNCGIIHLIDVVRKDVNKVFNEEKLIDKTKVTCVKWIPNSRQFFLTSHASGQLYLYNEELPCSTAPPNYQLFKCGNGYAIHVCKTKSTRNPLYRWVIGSEGCSINEFAFSPCNTYLAVVSQDGFLRVFHYDTMELVGFARSYFGGFLCVCWSPDSKYVAVGGEDDLVTIWSLQDKRVIARGQGHHSWVNVVAFDPYVSVIRGTENNVEDQQVTCYRLGSVGQDAQLCLWDITDDVLRQQPSCNSLSLSRVRNSAVCCTANGEACMIGNSVMNHCNNNNNNNVIGSSLKGSHNELHAGQQRHSPFLSKRWVSLPFGDKRDTGTSSNKKVRNAVTSDKSGNCTLNYGAHDDPMKLIGTPACPRFDQCPLLEPLICKKIANERLSALVFKEDCILTSCYDGSVSTWARPGKINRSNAHLVATSSTIPTNVPVENSGAVV